MSGSSDHDKFSTIWKKVNSMLPERLATDFLAGVFAGVVGTAFGHPLDTIKVRLQTQTQYKSALDCFLHIVKTEGIKGLFKGIMSPMVSLTILNSISFTLYGQTKKMISIHLNNSSTEPLKVYQYYLAGSVVGLASSIISTPFEMVKVRMQLDNITTRKYTGSLQCTVDLVKNHGILSLFTGGIVNTYREIIFCTVYFGLFENLKSNFNILFASTPYSHQASVLIAGGCAGVGGWLACFPLDVVKSNIQGQSLIAPRHNMMYYITQRWKTVGFTGFYNGIGPSLLRAFIVSASRFSAYEYALSVLQRL